MKLYLSSYRLGRDPENLRDLVGRQGRAGIVLNACDAFEEPRRVYAREVEDMRALGFEAEELDLREFFDGKGALHARLARYAVLWVVGGNAFVLARAMTASGFGAAALDHLQTGSLVYAGYSAGACVTGPDLEGVRLMDQPDALPERYSDSMPPRTLGWVPWRIVPHWRSDHPESASAELAASYLEAAGLPYRTLSDGDAIVIDGEDS